MSKTKQNNFCCIRFGHSKDYDCYEALHVFPERVPVHHTQCVILIQGCLQND